MSTMDKNKEIGAIVEGELIEAMTKRIVGTKHGSFIRGWGLYTKGPKVVIHVTTKQK